MSYPATGVTIQPFASLPPPPGESLGPASLLFQPDQVERENSEGAIISGHGYRLPGTRGVPPPPPRARGIPPSSSSSSPLEVLLVFFMMMVLLVL